MLALSVIIGGDIAFYAPTSYALESEQLSSELPDVRQNTQAQICNGCSSQSRVIRAARRLQDFTEELLWDARVDNYEKSEGVQNLKNIAIQKVTIAIQRDGGIVSTRSSYRCYSAVHRALDLSIQKGSNVDISSRYAKHAGPVLENAGFVNLLNTPYGKKIKSPYDAPSGAVLVYDGGKYGHAEIRVKGEAQVKGRTLTVDGFVSDYYSKRARTGEPENEFNGNNRILTGVYIKVDDSKEIL